jgi:hypothetical protein
MLGASAKGKSAFDQDAAGAVDFQLRYPQWGIFREIETA